MGQRNATTNSGKNPVDRSDTWASGHFDFLLKPGISDSYRARILAIKNDAINRHEKHNKQNSLHYPNNRK